MIGEKEIKNMFEKAEKALIATMGEHGYKVKRRGKVIEFEMR